MEVFMVKKYIFGTPFETEAVLENIPLEKNNNIGIGNVSLKDGFNFTLTMDKDDVVYGLGENVRGINKRGYEYVSNCSDDPHHLESTVSLYGAHNFIVVSGKTHTGFFFDYPSNIKFDVGYTKRDILEVTCERADLYVYVITGESAYDVVKQFRKIIGKSYIAPKFAFGFGQSRWGYKSAEDIENVVKGYRDNNIPIDMVYLDIDYMQDYKDFTVNPERFPNFEEFVDRLKKEHIRLVPIIDAGVKIEDGYDVYEEGVENGYFCKRDDDTDFVAAVWPGWTHFPDFLNKDAREWFGYQYKKLIDMGIEGFWNDMNEPAIFYSEEGIDEVNKAIKDYVNRNNHDMSSDDILDAANALPNTVKDKIEHVQNNPEDYKRFYHNVNGKMVRHDLVHNVFGYNMSRAAGEAFKKISPDKPILMFSRSSYIGMHRYAGIWTGDNKSWWSHLLLNLKMMPSLNMCGFIYTGADLGGFGGDSSRDLVLRWLALGVFTPLMRNHSAIGTRQQECYQFEDIEDFSHVIGVRYRLVPYIYSEYLKAVNNDDMYFKPLGFEYPDDKRAVETEDQLFVGNEIMIAPVYTQNATGRYVYLPDDMKFIKFMPDGTIYEEDMTKGDHYINVELNEVPLFVRKDKCIPIVDVAKSVEEIDMSTLKYIGYKDAEYILVE
jgi:alpha-glucosidase